MANETKRSSLYDLCNQICALLEASDGELTADVEVRLAELTPQFEGKVEALAATIEQLDASRKQLAELAATYEQRAKGRRLTIERLREYVEEQMRRAGVTAVKTPTCNVSIQRNGKAALVLNVPVEQVPDEYVMLVRTLMKDRITQALNDGIALGFAHLERGTHIRFR